MLKMKFSKILEKIKIYIKNETKTAFFASKKLDFCLNVEKILKNSGKSFKKELISIKFSKNENFKNS